MTELAQIDSLADARVEKNQGFGAQIYGVDVNTTPSDSPIWAEIRQAIYDNKLIVLKGQSLDEKTYVEFAKKLGRPQIYFQPQYHHPDHPEIFVSSNVKELEGQHMGVSGTGRYWHTDCAFEPHPLSFTSLLPQVFPKAKRETYYMDMTKVYAELPLKLRAIVDNATVQHEGQMRYKVQASDIDRSLRELLDRINEEVPPVQHPAVITHPATKEKILYVNNGFSTKIIGLSYEENQKVMQELFDFMAQPRFSHTHVWEEGDLIVWDNRFLNHMASTIPAGALSKTYRIGIYDDLPFYDGIAE